MIKIKLVGLDESSLQAVRELQTLLKFTLDESGSAITCVKQEEGLSKIVF